MSLGDSYKLDSYKKKSVYSFTSHYLGNGAFVCRTLKSMLFARNFSLNLYRTLIATDIPFTMCNAKKNIQNRGYVASS